MNAWMRKLELGKRQGRKLCHSHVRAVACVNMCSIPNQTKRQNEIVCVSPFAYVKTLKPCVSRYTIHSVKGFKNAIQKDIIEVVKFQCFTRKLSSQSELVKSEKFKQDSIQHKVKQTERNARYMSC